MYTGVTPAKLPDKVPASVESSPHACFALTESLYICYCNPAWDRFALENGGGADVLAASVLHKPFLQFVTDELRENIKNLFQRARTFGRLQSQDYECSSAQVFRLYRMQVYPLQSGSGFVVNNSLVVVHPHTRAICEPDDSIYRCKLGLIHMCANCRRTRRVDDPAAWDWVPAYVAHTRRDATHTVCPFCREYYYGAYLPGAAQE
ncbi:MAG: hypothetical protein LAO76_26790 [Acidobacteriia bacterium]|nr:hypothetical protein [Terriglobia bacterium]